MNILKSLSYLLVGLTLFEITYAEPQWHNSTDGRRYLIEREYKYNWFKAHHECARRNLQLVEIDSEAKNKALVDLFKSLFGNSINIWLGANDEFNTDRNFQRPFYWSTSGRPMTFTYWSNDNPDNFRNNEHCVHTWASAPDFRWNDVNCDAVMGFICENNYLNDNNQKLCEEKQKRLNEIISKLVRDFQENQKLQMEKLEKAEKDSLKDENELNEHIQSIQNKLENDIKYALSQNRRDLKSALEDRSKTINDLNLEMRVAAEIMSKKFNKEFEAVQNVIKDMTEK